jgi:hypothetical protein
MIELILIYTPTEIKWSLKYEYDNYDLWRYR